MKPWSRRHSALAGLALLVATNAVVLAGVAWNRSGEPDSVVRLSQRELYVPYAWGMRSENSGISLRLRWQVAGGSNAGYARAADWLDKAKLGELGFDVSAPADARRFTRQLPKEVLLVLELDGDAYRKALARARARLEEAQARLAAKPADRSAKTAASSTARRFAWTRDSASRLYVIDAGLDKAALRARYPDRAHYIIVRGRVRIGATALRGGSRFTGYVAGLSVPEINVPARARRVFEAARSRAANISFPRGAGEQGPRYEVEVAFGRLLEPWLLEARRVAKAGR